jgi:two-component system nitrogen regulation sensor histidine kinase NtrY
MADHSPSTDRIFAAPGVGPPATFRGGPQDSPRLVLVAIAVVVVALVWLLRLARRSSQLTPDYLAEVVLYALSAACLVMLLALGFVLARNLIKILAERRRAVPFARFRAKLVAALVGLTLIPSVLVLLVGSEVIRSSAERWFSAPIDEALS